MGIAVAGKQWRHKKIHLRIEAEFFGYKKLHVRNPLFQVARLPEKETHSGFLTTFHKSWRAELKNIQIP